MSQTAADLPITFRQILLATVDAEFRRDAIETFLADREARPVVQEALRTVAAMRKLRPQTISQFGRAEKVNLIAGSLSQPMFETSAMQILQVWFLRKGRPLMATLLDAWGVSHSNGELEEDAIVPPLQASQVREAVAALGPEHSPSAIDAYLAYSLLAPPEDSWSEACGVVLSERTASKG
ncbi:MAG: hypothetical protein H6686_01535 [Fibrobacteria bacterium]|nr:hypothetical protein [Fibrobacteria bacterium]